MSKKFRNKPCAYCGKPAATADHVIAREFLPMHLRGGLPKVPACQACNKEKSDLEHYFATLLSLGAQHPAASHGLGKLGSRLSKNRPLTTQLAQGFRELDNGGAIIQIRAQDVHRFSEFLLRGLVFYEFGIVIDDRFRVEAAAWQDAGLETMSNTFREGFTEIHQSLADGAVTYTGYMATDHKPLSAWRIRLLGGIAFGGEGTVDKPAGHEFGGIVTHA